MINSALERCHALLRGMDLRPKEPSIRPVRRVAVGDPQTTAARFFAVLEARGLLGDDGWLRPDVQLVSMGDHFDFKVGADLAQATRIQDEAGRSILNWLAAHPPTQVEILVGNHDIMRVQELYRITDEDFMAARQLAQQHQGDEATGDSAVRRVSRALAEDLPTASMLIKDCAGFTTAQRTLVSRMLRVGRMKLATSAVRSGQPVLLTHAAVTTVEASVLAGRDSPLPRDRSGRVAWFVERLNGALRAAIRGWRDGPLDLRPLHVSGTPGLEGGGLLFHRPAHPIAKRFEPEVRRRFHPATLPSNLAQVCAHVQDDKCRAELGDWVREGSAAAGGMIRTLTRRHGKISYDLGVDVDLDHTGDRTAAALVFVDGSMNTVDPEHFEVLELQPEAP